MIYDRIKSRTKLNKGWSLDQKYQVETIEGTYLLRISDSSKERQRRAEFSNMQKVKEANVRMCQALEIGLIDEGVYVIHEWIRGKDLYDLIESYDEIKQYELGREAGEMLKKIHSIERDENVQMDWEDYFNNKVDKKIAAYVNCEQKYDQDYLFLDYLETNRNLLKNRPIVFMHGDFHIGNMMINEEGQLVIIDFDRSDYGDPYEEFNRIVWSAQASSAFASGIVDAYFNDDVPTLFWKLLLFYIISNTISSLPWTMQYDSSGESVMRKQASQVLSWYDNLKDEIPSWYLSHLKRENSSHK